MRAKTVDPAGCPGAMAVASAVVEAATLAPAESTTVLVTLPGE